MQSKRKTWAIFKLTIKIEPVFAKIWSFAKQIYFKIEKKEVQLYFFILFGRPKIAKQIEIKLRSVRVKKKKKLSQFSNVNQIHRRKP